MSNHDNIVKFLYELRNAAEPMFEIFSAGSCFRLCLMLRAIYPQANFLYSQIAGHWITEIDGKHYDIGGWIAPLYVHGDNTKYQAHPEFEVSAHLPKWSLSHGMVVSYTKYTDGRVLQFDNGIYYSVVELVEPMFGYIAGQRMIMLTRDVFVPCGNVNSDNIISGNLLYNLPEGTYIIREFKVELNSLRCSRISVSQLELHQDLRLIESGDFNMMQHFKFHELAQSMGFIK